MKWLNAILLIIFISIITVQGYYLYNINEQLDLVKADTQQLIRNTPEYKAEQAKLAEIKKQIQEYNERKSTTNSEQFDGNSINANQSTGYSGNIDQSNNYSISSNNKKCAFPNCDSDVFGNKPYCFQHSCREMGCLNHIQNTYGYYCEYHTCSYPNCNQQKAYNSNYCLMHQK